MKLMPFAALLLATSAAPALAGEVLMLDHTPSVEELRGYLAPTDAPRRTRGIEILAQPAAPAMPTTKAAATMDMPASPEPVVATATAPEPTTPEPTTIGYRIQFAYNSADIQPESRSFLDQLGQVLQSEPNLALAVEGHTDAHGSAAYNMGLSQRRAAAVQSYLSTVWQVPAERLTVSGKGESEPLTPNGNAAENRRVQFRPLS
ncbi:MAG: OmpA family protein [Rhodospirillaceae bacterium]|nr:OmpA family protein [Rhodospirillales bacterium]